MRFYLQKKYSFALLMQGFKTNLWSRLPSGILLVIMVLSLSFRNGYGQQKISLTYDKPMLKEDFNEENKNWNYQTTYENFFVVDKGDLFLNRINPTNPYAFLSNWDNPLTTFQIRSALKLAPDQGKEQTIGIIFLVQKDGSGAVVLEINRDKEYRIKQLVNGKFYKYLSGEKETQGWVKSTLVNAKEDYNELDVRVKEGQMDFYINKKFVNSFNVDNYKSGGLGFLIGANTKAKIDFFNVYGTNTAEDSLQNLNGTYVNKLHGEELIAKQEKDIDSLKREVREANQKYSNYQRDRDQEHLRMKDLLEKYIRQNDSLEIRARKLTFLEDEMLQGIDNDLLLTLTTELREQIKKNQALEAQVEGYKDSIYYMNKKFQELKVKLLTTVIDKRSAEVKSQEQALKEIKTELQKKSNQTNAAQANEPAEEPKQKATTKDSKANSKKKDESKDNKAVISSSQAPMDDPIRPNPRSKNNQSKADSAQIFQPMILKDSIIKEPQPIPSRVKKAKKGNRQ
jgi:hypothetical protein